MSDRNSDLEMGSVNRRRILKGIGATMTASTIVSSGIVSAESADINSRGRSIERALATMDPYMDLDSEYLIHVDTEQAKADDVNQRARNTALELKEMNNILIDELLNGDSTITNIESNRYNKLQRKFSPYFELIANGKLKKYTSAEIEPLAGGCGGNDNDPHPCPCYQWSKYTWDSKSDVKDALRSWGWDKTPKYASYYGYGDDFTKVTDAYGCPNGPFRKHGLIREHNGGWSFKKQTPEPNPVVHSYATNHPSIDWTAYVKWWHDWCDGSPC